MTDRVENGQLSGKKGDLAGVQGLYGSVTAVSHNRASDSGKLQPNLMLAAGFQFDFKQAYTAC